MSGKPNGKDTAAEPSPEEQAQTEFMSGWDDAGAELSGDTRPGKTEQPHKPPQSGTEADASRGGSASVPSAAGGEETPPAEGEGTKKPAAAAAGEGADAPDGGEPPPSNGGGEEPDPLDARFQALEDKILRSVDERSTKSDRELKGTLGRIQKALEGGGTAQQRTQQQTQTAAETSAAASAVPEKLKARLEKLRETDPETAEAIELTFEAFGSQAQSQGQKIEALETRLAEGEQRGQQRSEQATVNARLDQLMQGIPWREYVQVDQQSGALVHEGFANWSAEQPYAKVQEFWNTEDAEIATKFIRSFHATLDGGGGPSKDPPPPASAGADGGQKGGTNGSTQAAPSAEDAKRRLQREAGTSIPGGKQAPPTDSPEANDTFEAGWKQAAAEESASKTAAANMRKERAAQHAGIAGI